jgi:hypothetical protein
LATVAEAYMNLRELHNAYKHGMRVFFGNLNDKGVQSTSIAYVDDEANVKLMSFPPKLVEEIYELGVQLGRVLGAILRWHDIRIRVTKAGAIQVSAPVFGRGDDKDKEIGMLMFPSVLETREILVTEGEKIAIERKEEVAKINRGHVIAIDIDSGDILSFHSPDLREVIWESLKARPAARLVFRRMTNEGKVGPC